MLSTAKIKLKMDILNTFKDKAVVEAFSKALESTFPDKTDTSKDIADQFGKIAANAMAVAVAPKLCDAVDAFVKEIGILITPTALVSPVGPVSGVISPTDVQIL